MLRVSDEFTWLFEARSLRSCDAVLRYFQAGELPEAGVTIRQATLGLSGGPETPVFFKQYNYRPPAWRFIGRASKARREFENYAVFHRLGIPAAQAIACGEQRDAIGRLRRAFILTRAIQGAVPLNEFVQKTCGDRSRRETRATRTRLIELIAAMTRRMHDAGFFHYDLVWRNLLVTPATNGASGVWWIDCPRGRFDHGSPLRRRRQLRDLASLDKVASQLCPAGERVKFIKAYLKSIRLDREAKQLIRGVLDYRRKRWPEDWRGR